jgi:hypothetical protein
MQYKSGGDENGVTGKLKDVTAWDPIMSSEILVWEGNDGRRVVVDGHQRVGLARGSLERGQDIDLPALVVGKPTGLPPLRRAFLALCGTSISAPAPGRQCPRAEGRAEAAEMLKGAENRREIEGLSRLSYEAFGAAINDVIDPRIAAEIGKHAPDPQRTWRWSGCWRRSASTIPPKRRRSSGRLWPMGSVTAQRKQLGMFGERAAAVALCADCAYIGAAAKKLREEKRTFKVLSEKAGKIEAAGMSWTGRPMRVR